MSIESKEFDVISNLNIKPYLIRAWWHCITDNNMTPILVIDGNNPKNTISKLFNNDFDEDNLLVISISNLATRDLIINNDMISFDCSKNGIITVIKIPIDSVHVLYCEENGDGFEFARKQYTKLTVIK